LQRKRGSKHQKTTRGSEKGFQGKELQGGGTLLRLGNKNGSLLPTRGNHRGGNAPCKIAGRAFRIGKKTSRPQARGEGVYFSSREWSSPLLSGGRKKHAF